MELFKRCMRALLRWLYGVKVYGLEHYVQAGDRVLIVANHTSFLDAVLLAAFLPHKLTFAIHTQVARRRWLRPVLKLVDVFPMDPTNPFSVKSLVKYIRQDRRAVIFPEGRITVTGSLMKIYQGPGLIADKSEATVLPVRIEGAQYTPFSRMRGRVRLRWFPPITLTILPPRRIRVADAVRGRARRNQAGRELQDLMTEMMFATSDYRRPLFQALLDARQVHGGGHVVAEDITRAPVTYDALVTRAFVLGAAMARATARGEYVGVLLPNMVNTLLAFLGLHIHARVPAMLNFTVGAAAMLSACQVAKIRTVYSSRQFVRAARLEPVVERLQTQVRIIYLEDLRDTIGLWDRLAGWLAARLAPSAYRRRSGGVRPDDPAVVLFTSGSEGTPKGVVLSHANLLANRAQLAARVDFSAHDVVLNALPLFHSFGLTAGTLLPLFSGMKVFFYPSPLHYRIVPEIAYDINATVLFGTNTFLTGYARFAHPYDFYSVRYVFAGAEKLQEETRRVWAEKFGVRIFEGYGATETSPVLATNTAMDNRPGSVGCLLPGIEYALTPMAGVAHGGRLEVRGPNVMLGYLLHGRDGLIPPQTERGVGWYDTGDIVSIDGDGHVCIQGRAKRFAKVGGEMVSLAVAEEIATRAWPAVRHAVVSVPDAQKGEQLVLVTEQADAERAALLARARADGVGELAVPRRILVTRTLPLLGSGKTDYPAVQALVAAEVTA